MLYTIMFAAMAQAAAISKSTSEAPSSSESLAERSTLIHNYALVCLYDRDATNFCQKTFGYGCDSMGKKRTNRYDQDCDVVCDCVDLFPKPACMVGLTGQSWCIRSLGEDETIKEVTHAEEDSSEKSSAAPMIRARSEAPHDGVNQQLTAHQNAPLSWQESVLNHATDMTTSSMLQSSLPSTNIHQWAIVCTTDHTTTLKCSSPACPCGPTGDIEIHGGQDQYFTQSCVCVDLLSREECFIGEDGLTICEKDDGVKDHNFFDIVLSASGHPTSYNPISLMHHNYAMVCADDKQETTWCANDGYYCDRNGKLRTPEDSSKFCSDNCVCNAVTSTTFCMMASDGAMYCLQSETVEAMQLSGRSQGSLPASDNVVNAVGGKAKRLQQHDAIDKVDNQHADAKAPFHEDNSDWGFNNYAMVCRNDKTYTWICQRDYGYMCNSRGSLTQSGAQRKAGPCEAYCQCIDLLPKSNCLLSLIGTAQCARHVPDPQSLP